MPKDASVLDNVVKSLFGTLLTRDPANNQEVAQYIQETIKYKKLIFVISLISI